ncbi:MAG TPA: RecX family transcriptional regulator [Candidatus Saccharimonadales bacterium]|nr:RecX family transcriptional regulator [Candidatus Saccharimonadales bacterium]
MNPVKITDIKQQVKRKDRYSIFIDGKYGFALSESGLLAGGLKVGQELSKPELDKLKETSVEDKAVYRVLELIARRPRSEGEIRDYLRRKKYEDQKIEKILSTLSSKGHINDEDFAFRWVENRRLLKPISKRKLRLELKQKKISEDIIQKILQDDETDEKEIIKELIEKKRRQSRYQDNQKLIAYLARQGFSYSDIKEAMDS